MTAPTIRQTGPAIRTRYLGPTTYRGARIVATYDGGPDGPQRLTVPYSYSAREAHHVALAAMVDRLRPTWRSIDDHDWIQTSVDSAGYVFAPILREDAP